MGGGSVCLETPFPLTTYRRGAPHGAREKEIHKGGVCCPGSRAFSEKAARAPTDLMRRELAIIPVF